MRVKNISMIAMVTDCRKYLMWFLIGKNLRSVVSSLKVLFMLQGVDSGSFGLNDDMSQRQQEKNGKKFIYLQF